jgi:hypothetical protein
MELGSTDTALVAGFGDITEFVGEFHDTQS